MIGDATLYVEDGRNGALCNAPMHWLKKIDPPAIPEHETQDEKIYA